MNMKSTNGVPVPKMHPEQNVKAAIVCEEFKLPKFKRALKDAGFTFKVHPFHNDCAVIKVATKAKRLEEIHRICKTLQINFNLSN